MSKSQSAKPIEIKISTVVAVSAILHATAPAVLEAAMQEITGGESDYFEGEFAVIDVGALDPADGGIDWGALIRLFKSHQLNPVAVRNAAPGMEAAILAHGLSLDVIAKPRHEAATPASVAVPVVPVAPPAPEPAAPAVLGSMIVDTPVRAGQRIYARGADLIVMAAVNNGAEVIADGSIHVYAPLRGRALAGASGNPDARIFALCMEPELVSIAGVYRTFEGGFPQEQANQPAQVRLVGDRIDVKAISPVAR
ncbi:MAG TPA: septum site-determining protein MinC [Paucimonas sp.]|nr:septum site-determining protein MinC [Paucimonas sp.]